MRQVMVWLVLAGAVGFAAPVVPDNYLTQDGNQTAYVYPADSQISINKISRYQHWVMRQYEQEFGYRLDQKLYLNLASQNNQIANGFSTQLPLNEQVFYGGGASNYDMFSSTSWLRTLLIHETAHNYQLNPKENTLSKLAHVIGGNAPVINPLFFPMFPIPNGTESSFILEGNAMLNESRFGNGGRLWSGHALAETVTQARAGNITPEKMYNRTLAFPYGEKFYLVGGHFQKFLVRQYGIKKVNSYFKSYASQALPFFGNSVFRKHFGKDFVTLIREFQATVRREHQGFVATHARAIARSQQLSNLEHDGGKIVALVGDLRSAPKLLQVDSSGKTSMRSGDWRSGKLFAWNGKYSTISSAHVSPRSTKIGLFDQEGYLVPGTEGKVMQGKLRDGRWVYFDVAQSWDEPHLYVGKEYYGVVNSSVLVRGNDLYYFRQQGEQRILYRNHQALTSYSGHDGRVVDVDERGRVYFTAPSVHGSTAYRVDRRGRIERVAVGDDVLDLKLLGRKRAMVQTIGADGYTIRSIVLHPRPASVATYRMPFRTIRLRDREFHDSGMAAPADYMAPAQLHYSSLVSESKYDQEYGFQFSLKVHFVDPLWQNSLSFVMAYQKQQTLLKASYANSAYPLHFGGTITAIKRHQGYRQGFGHVWGYSAYLSLPFLAQGYWRGSATLAYARPYGHDERRPLTFSMGVQKRVQHGYSKYPNELMGLSGFVSYDRGVVYEGLRAEWMHDIPGEFYLGLRGAYMRSSAMKGREQKGIKVGGSASRADRAVMNIQTLAGTHYVQSAMMGEAAIYKVLNLTHYNYHIPFSLQRESLYFKQRVYAVNMGNGKSNIQYESVAGVEADLLVLHRYTVPVTLEMLYNPAVEKHIQYRVGVKYRF